MVPAAKRPWLDPVCLFGSFLHMRVFTNVVGQIKKGVLVVLGGAWVSGVGNIVLRWCTATPPPADRSRW